MFALYAQGVKACATTPGKVENLTTPTQLVKCQFEKQLAILKIKKS